MDTLLPGISAERLPTSRLTVNTLSVAEREDHDGPAVLFVHGNVSSSLFWQPTMLALPEPYRPLAIDLRGFGDTDDEPIDATRGLRDFSDDLAAAIEALHEDAVHLVGWSMGGGVVLQYLVDRPGAHRVASLTLVDPVSPFGFGGTKGVDGMLCDPWGAGSGGGGANPEFVERLAGKDRTGKGPLSPRQVLLAHYVKPPHVPEHLDIFVESMLSTRVGDDYYPGTWRPVDAWPGFAPGDRGVLNTMAPTHFRIADLAAAAHGGADPRRPERLRRGRRPLPRGRHRRRGPRPPPRPARPLPRRANRSSRQRVNQASITAGTCPRCGTGSRTRRNPPGLLAHDRGGDATLTRRGRRPPRAAGPAFQR